MKTFLSQYPSLRQLLRYGVVGVLNNLLGYGVYLLVTYFWLEPKLAITLLYPIGVTTAYFGHSKYSFAGKTRDLRTVVRYLLAHFVGYAINVLLLLFLSDMLQFPHQIVQASAIFVVAGALFFTFRYFVFPTPDIKPEKI